MITFSKMIENSLFFNQSFYGIGHKESNNETGTACPVEAGYILLYRLFYDVPERNNSFVKGAQA
jgi:hypothetical protein